MKNEFDDIIKKKWEKFHFQVDPQHRNDMNALLDQTHRRKGGIAWWLGAIALLFMLGAGVYYFNVGNNSFSENLSADQESDLIDRKSVV